MLSAKGLFLTLQQGILNHRMLEEIIVIVKNGKITNVLPALTKTFLNFHLNFLM